MEFAQYLTSAGINESVVYAMLILPFIALLVSFLRYFIGIKTFGIYESIVLSFALYSISADFLTGIKVGLPIIIAAWIASEVTNNLLKKTRIHYISKVSLKISVASIIILAAAFLSVQFQKNIFGNVNFISLVIILTLIESISLFQYKKGDPYTNLISLETIIVTTLSYLIISTNTIRAMILTYPYLVFVAIFLNFLVGRWTGLRLFELIRFKNVVKDD